MSSINLQVLRTLFKLPPDATVEDLNAVINKLIDTQRQAGAGLITLSASVLDREKLLSVLDLAVDASDDDVNLVIYKTMGQMCGLGGKMLDDYVSLMIEQSGGPQIMELSAD